MQAARSWVLEIMALGQRSIRSFLDHSMPTHASALAYQGLFALFPFMIFLGVLLVMLQVDSFFGGLIEQARSLHNRSRNRWNRCSSRCDPRYPRRFWRR